MGKKLQILFSCSFLFHLTYLNVAMLGKCFIQLLGCSHLPQWSHESLIPAKPECKEHPFQSFYSHLTASHCSQRDALMCKASPIPPRGQTCTTGCHLTAAGTALHGPRASSGFVHPSGRELVLTQPGMLESRVPCE